MTRAKYLLFFLFCSLSCHSQSRQKEVTIRNDIQDEAYNHILVDQVQSASGSSSLKFELAPGEEKPLPMKQITKFRVTRDYKDFSRIYFVSCPAKKEKILIKLIDVHLNRLPGGCIMTKVGERRGGITSWRE